MNLQELRKIRINNDFNDMAALDESGLIEWEVTKGERPYAEEYLFNINIQTYSAKGELYSPVKVRVTLPEDYPRAAPVYKAEGTVPFHPNWEQESGTWSYGEYHPTDYLVAEILRMVRELQYKPSFINNKSERVRNQEAEKWYEDNKDNIEMFPCDKSDVKIPDENEWTVSNERV